jgi:RNA polymerase sigma-70 factor (ECF subfamily)
MSFEEFQQAATANLGSLLALASRLARNQADAEDLVQETFVKAMRARSQFETGTNIRAWLMRILTNTFINRFRRGGLERSVIDGPDADPLADGWIGASTMQAMRDPESTALRPLLEAEIQTALDNLPEEFRLPVLLVDVEELSYREAAEVMNCPIGTVMSRLHRGRRQLRSHLIEHARAIGLVSPEHVLGEEPPGDAPLDLESFRQRKAARS